PTIGPRTDPMLEGYTVLAGIAARTTKVRLGTLVTGVTYRNPASHGKSRHDARYRLVGASDPRDRGGLERGRAPRLRLRVPAGGRTPEPAGGGSANLPGHIPRGSAQLRRPLLPHSGRAQFPSSGATGL